MNKRYTLYRHIIPSSARLHNDTSLARSRLLIIRPPRKKVASSREARRIGHKLCNIPPLSAARTQSHITQLQLQAAG